MHSFFLVAVVHSNLALSHWVHFKDTLALLFFSHFEGSSLWCAYHNHRFGAVSLVHCSVDIHHIFISNVVELPHLLILKEIFADFSIKFLNTLIKSFLLFTHIIHLLSHFWNLPFDFWVLVASNPPDCIFLSFLNIIYSFKDIGNIIDSPFLNFQLFNCYV